MTASFGEYSAFACSACGTEWTVIQPRRRRYLGVVRFECCPQCSRIVRSAGVVYETWRLKDWLASHECRDVDPAFVEAFEHIVIDRDGYVIGLSKGVTE